MEMAKFEKMEHFLVLVSISNSWKWQSLKRWSIFWFLSQFQTHGNGKV
jgi:hypothetical protein